MDEKREAIYEALFDQLRHLENRAFATLGNFLTANAFAFVAWATFYGYVRDVAGFRVSDWILVALAVAGYMGGLAWALLGARNWEYCRRIVGEMIRVGGEYQSGSRADVYHAMRGLEEAVHKAWDKKLKLGAFSYYSSIIPGTPLMVAALYLVLLLVLLWVRQPWPFGCEPWLLPALIAAIGVVPLVVVFCACHSSRTDGNDAVKDAKDSVKPRAPQAS